MDDTDKRAHPEKENGTHKNCASFAKRSAAVPALINIYQCFIRNDDVATATSTTQLLALISFLETRVQCPAIHFRFIFKSFWPIQSLFINGNKTTCGRSSYNTLILDMPDCMITYLLSLVDLEKKNWFFALVEHAWWIFKNVWICILPGPFVFTEGKYLAQSLALEYFRTEVFSSKKSF